MANTMTASSRGRALRTALFALAVAFSLLTGVVVVLIIEGPLDPVWVGLLMPAAALIYFAAGTLASLRRPTSALGALLIAGAIVMLLADLGNTDHPSLIAVGQIVATVPLAIVIHLLVAFPSGRLVHRGDQTLVLAGYAVALILQAPLYLFADFPPPYDVLQVAVRPDLVDDAQRVQRIAGIAVVFVTAAVLALRLRRAPPAQRNVMVPLFAYGIVVVPFVPLSAIVIAPLLDWSVITLFVVQVTALALVPLAFGVSIMRGAFARTADIEELGAWLGADEAVRPPLRDALANALGDPSIDLGFWAPERHGYVDANGHDIRVPVDGSGRTGVEIELAGRLVGVISYDSTLVTEPELVRTAGSVVAIAVDRLRLIADLRANEEALRHSRRRIVEAGDRERRRIERNLHDGAQQRMMSLALAIRLAGAKVDDSDAETRALLADAAGELDDAMRELRELARGLHPALLADAGLEGALEALAERSSIPVQLSFRLDDHVSEAIQAGAYYVVAEALTNAARYSGASRVWVHAAASHGALDVIVRDDGKGGAHVLPGSGLEGLTDRVDSLGGKLDLLSPDGCGTRVMVKLPCE
jgi:signal transduction histidine kinase